MNMIRFIKSENEYTAKQSSDQDAIYFTRDTHTIVVGGQEYGFSSEAKNRLDAAELSVIDAQQSATEARNYAQDVSRDVYYLYGILGSLPDGSAVTERVARIEANKVSAWSNTPDNDHYPSELLVKETIDSITPEFLSNEEIQQLWYTTMGTL